MFRQHAWKNCSGYSAVKSVLQFSSMSFITQRKPILVESRRLYDVFNEISTEIVPTVSPANWKLNGI